MLICYFGRSFACKITAFCIYLQQNRRNLMLFCWIFKQNVYLCIGM